MLSTRVNRSEWSSSQDESCGPATTWGAPCQWQGFSHCRTESTADYRPQDFEALRAISAGHRMFSLSETLLVLLSAESGLWYAECPSLGIIASGTSKEAALDSFEEDFAVLWDEIASEQDSALAADAQRVKKFFHRIVKAVDHE